MLLFEGLKVLDVGTWIAGPVSTTILADFGASVIKVEIPGPGDPYRQLPNGAMSPNADVNYTWILDAHNKRSVALNLKTEDGKKILRQLVRQCDVYVTNQPMGVRRSLGLTYEDLSPLNDRMIFASLTAYGEKGPEADKEGFDGVAWWTRSGLADLVRTPGAPPGASVPGMGDHPTAVALFACIMMGLYRRQMTGKGTRVATSLLANGFWSNSCLGQAALVNADFSPRRDRGPGQIPWVRTFYEASDGRLLQLNMVRSAQDQEKLLHMVGLGGLLEDERFETPAARRANSAGLASALREKFVTRSSVDWISSLSAEGVNIARLATVEDMSQDEQAIANDILTAPDGRVGVPWVINAPLFVDGVERVRPGRSPEVGEHTEEILTELGYDAAAVSRLRDNDVI